MPSTFVTRSVMTAPFSQPQNQLFGIASGGSGSGFGGFGSSFSSTAFGGDLATSASSLSSAPFTFAAASSAEFNQFGAAGALGSSFAFGGGGLADFAAPPSSDVLGMAAPPPTTSPFVDASGAAVSIAFRILAPDSSDDTSTFHSMSLMDISGLKAGPEDVFAWRNAHYKHRRYKTQYMSGSNTHCLPHVVLPSNHPRTRIISELFAHGQIILSPVTVHVHRQDGNDAAAAISVIDSSTMTSQDEFDAAITSAGQSPDYFGE